MASSVNLGEALESFIDKAISTGRYGSRSEVLREGVRLVQEREALWARFDADMQVGIDASKAGLTKPAEEVFDRLIAKYQSMSNERKRAA